MPRWLDLKLLALRKVAHALFPDYRLTWPQIGWWRDPAFNEYLDRFGERRGFNTHRRFMVAQLLRLIEDVEGDTAECGVFEGAGSWLICQAGRTHHIFDSFEGLSAPSASDGAYWHQGAMSAGEDIVLYNLSPFEPELHKGWIPDAFPEVADRTFAFVHIDVDLYQPTLDSLAFFHPRLAPGGIIVCDDYGLTTCPGATRAVDEFLADKPEKMVLLDGGGGFLIKGTRTKP
jgi:O-methyltransferase